ncbi:methyltransferase domain-containing protein, partial [Actinospica durhamensis]
MNTRQEFWDERYRGHERLFSGNPNAVLVAEAADLEPGRALDVGCGEGADALWLARNGWQVTAIDIAPTALTRAAESATPGAAVIDRADAAASAESPALADRVTWTCADLAVT